MLRNWNESAQLADSHVLNRAQSKLGRTGLPDMLTHSSGIRRLSEENQGLSTVESKSEQCSPLRCARSCWISSACCWIFSACCCSCCFARRCDSSACSAASGSALTLVAVGCCTGAICARFSFPQQRIELSTQERNSEEEYNKL